MVNRIFPHAKNGLWIKPAFHGNTWKAVARSANDARGMAAIFLPISAYMASKEAPGERLAAFVPEVIGFGTGMVSAGITTAAMSALVPGFGMMGVGTRAMIGMLVSDFAINPRMVSAMQQGFRQVSGLNARQRSLEMGTGFRDSQNAANLRMSAIQEISSSFGAARRYLGQEARFLHS